MLRKTLALLISTALLVPATAVHAQADFPSKPIRMIVVYPAGGGGDILARTVGEAMSKIAGQPTVVENRGGANGMIGAAACKNAAPDGYTYCLVLSDVVAINPFIHKSVPYDVEKDLVAVAAVAAAPALFVANGAVPASNLKELASYSTAQKGKSNWASWGVGSAGHILMEYMNKSYGTDFVHVPYQGAQQAIQALLTREVDAGIAASGLVAQHIASGKLKALGVLNDKRLPQFPDVPTALEQGLNFPATLWYGIFAPAATPKATVDKMNALIGQSLGDPAVAKLLNTFGLLPMNESPAAFAQRVQRDVGIWGPVAKSLKLSLE